MDGNTEENKDYKYVMQDVGNVYFGARFSYREMISDENVPFKFKTIVERYIGKDLDPEVTLESHFYYMKEEGFDFQSYKQLRAKVRFNILSEKKKRFGKPVKRYTTQILPVEKFVRIPEEEKKEKGVMIQEIAISKLGLMTFSV